VAHLERSAKVTHLMETPNDPMSQDDTSRLTIPQVAGDAVADILTGATIPAPIRRNALKAFSRLCSAAVEIPIAYFEGVAAEKRAEASARVKLIETNADQIARQMEVDPAYARVAVRKFGQRIIREQVNLDSVSDEAARQITESKSLQSNDGDKEVDDDWLNQFEKEACQRSAPEMQRLFGRILAGEIIRPSSFSIRAVRILGQLDSGTAALFRRFCSACIAIRIPGSNHVLDARIPSLGGNAASNSLQEFGLSFTNLNVLQENGLVISDYNSWMEYQTCVVRDRTVPLPFKYQNAYWGFQPTAPREALAQLRIHGVALTKAGQELQDIVDINPFPEFHSKFVEFLRRSNLELVSVKVQ
jgi:hypothetical protein